jgi:hypothetical protein
MQYANHADRNVHTAILGPFSSLDGVVEYHPRVNDLVDPSDALSDAYTSTLLNCDATYLSNRGICCCYSMSCPTRQSSLR